MLKRNNYNLLEDISSEKWNNLIRKTIFFGHQSVGQNIVEGINDLIKDHAWVKLNVIEQKDEELIEKSGFIHRRIGKNRDPFSKMDQFAAVLEGDSIHRPEISFLKFCYVDINSKTDINTVFEKYKHTMGNLKKMCPETLIIHFTVPLTVKKETIKTRLKKMIGKNHIWEYEDNIKRNQFSELIRSEYLGREPVFDIADIEASKLDGSKETFKHKGEKYLSLAPEHTDDGGHLNKTGREKIAVNLLEFLLNV